MGDLKLYNAWYKSWISKFSIEEKNQFWQETASLPNCYQIISIVHQSCHMQTQTRYYIIKHTRF